MKTGTIRKIIPHPIPIPSEDKSQDLISFIGKKDSESKIDPIDISRKTWSADNFERDLINIQKEEFLLKKEVVMGKLEIKREKVRNAHELELKKFELEERRLINENLKLQVELKKNILV